MATLRDIAHAYHDFVERRVRSPRSRHTFHVIQAGAHASYFGGVAAHAFEFYGPVAAVLFGMTIVQLLIGGLEA